MQKQSRFGSGVAVLDINLDGVLDLAVGSPAYYIDSPLEYKVCIRSWHRYQNIYAPFFFSYYSVSTEVPHPHFEGYALWVSFCIGHFGSKVIEPN